MLVFRARRRSCDSDLTKPPGLSKKKKKSNTMALQKFHSVVYYRSLSCISRVSASFLYLISILVRRTHCKRRVASRRACVRERRDDASARARVARRSTFLASVVVESASSRVRVLRKHRLPPPASRPGTEPSHKKKKQEKQNITISDFRRRADEKARAKNDPH